MYDHLVQFAVIWYIFPILGCLDQEKAGNPGQKSNMSKDIISKKYWTCGTRLTPLDRPHKGPQNVVGDSHLVLG
jgi:hypothetical protein